MFPKNLNFFKYHTTLLEPVVRQLSAPIGQWQKLCLWWLILQHLHLKIWWYLNDLSLKNDLKIESVVRNFGNLLQISYFNKNIANSLYFWLLNGQMLYLNNLSKSLISVNIGLWNGILNEL